LLSGAAMPLVSPRAEAIPRCGKCADGTSGSDYVCSGSASNCSECTVCAK
jgi:hypothetical protein